ncbi:MAG: hypothetical protein KAU50_11705 [Candidatus Marinimicrobia bacterium]|nr:hypothetical protein [Candidatus Neomarinimicrobiota bacterium]
MRYRRMNDRRLHRAIEKMLFIGLFMSLTASLARGQDKESVAVLDLEGRGISTMEAATLTDRMRSELVKTGAVTVVERGQMQTILQEQDFQMTGCTSDECAVEIGQMLGVTMMYSGSIGKIGATYTVDVRTISIETGAIVNTMSRDYRGEIDGLITEIERLSWELVGLVHPDDLLQQVIDEPSISLDEVAKRDAAAAKPKKKGSWLKRIIILAAIGGGGYAGYTMLGGEEETTDLIGTPPVFPGPVQQN